MLELCNTIKMIEFPFKPIELIAVVPNEFNQNQKDLLKYLIESTGLKLIKYQNDLQQLFNKIINLNQFNNVKTIKLKKITVFFFL